MSKMSEVYLYWLDIYRHIDQQNFELWYRLCYCYFVGQFHKCGITNYIHIDTVYISTNDIGHS